MSTQHSNRREFMGAMAASSGALFLNACSGKSDTPAPAASSAPAVPFKPKRVFLLTMDTVRMDHLGCYGYPRITSPFMDSLAESGLRFRESLCACSNTLPSHVSLFSGLQIEQHGLHHNGYLAIHPDVYMLPQLFSDAGYKTGSFTSVVWMNLMGQGFDHHDGYNEKYVQDNSTTRYYRKADETFRQCTDWVESLSPDDDFFTWIHVYDPHNPFYPPEDLFTEFTQDFERRPDELFQYWMQDQKKTLHCHEYDGKRSKLAEMHNYYDAEIRFVDRELERLYKAAEAKGLLEDSLWIITTDHGEGMGQHEYWGHGMHIYDEQMLSPFIMHTPGGQYGPRVVQETIHHIDLLPTMASILEQPLPDIPLTRTGHNLHGLLTDPKHQLPPRNHYYQRRKRKSSGFTQDWEEGPIVGLKGDTHTVIHHRNGQHEVYNNEQDPHQLENLFAKNLPEGNALLKEAEAQYALFDKEAEAVHGVRSDDAPQDAVPFLEELEALGYIGGDGQAEDVE